MSYSIYRATVLTDCLLQELLKLCIFICMYPITLNPSLEIVKTVLN
jgi:hypothetical protein